MCVPARAGAICGGSRRVRSSYVVQWHMREGQEYISPMHWERESDTAGAGAAFWREGRAGRAAGLALARVESQERSDRACAVCAFELVMLARALDCKSRTIQS